MGVKKTKAYFITDAPINKMQMDLSAALRWCLSETDFLHCSMPKGGDDRLLCTNDLLKAIYQFITEGKCSKTNQIMCVYELTSVSNCLSPSCRNTKCFPEAKRPNNF